MDLYATHQPMLVAAVMESNGPVLELGMGDSSTPLLHILCPHRKLLSFESDKAWSNKFSYLNTGSHALIHVDSYDAADGALKENWAVAFVDHGPEERRIVDIRKLTHAQFVVVHDWEVPVYRYSEIESFFKEKIICKRLTPWTAVLSNGYLGGVERRLKEFI